MSFAVRFVTKGELDIGAVDYIEALSIHSSVLRHLTEIVMADVDVLMLPVSMPSAPKFKSPETMESAEIDRNISTMANMTRFADYLRPPLYRFRLSVSPEGLPTALQLDVKPFEENTVLKVPSRYEALRRPFSNLKLD